MIDGIIVADDDSMIRGILRSLFASVGQQVASTSNGEQAVDLASRMQAKLILLDMNMPRLNGLVACQRIRALPGHASTPVVVLTVCREPDASKAAFKAGATLYIAKPFQPMALLEALLPYLNLNSFNQEGIIKAAQRVREMGRSDRKQNFSWLLRN